MYYRVGLPFPFRLGITKQDAEPIKGDKMSMCVGSVCNNYVLDETGIIDVVIPSGVLMKGKEIVVKPVNPGIQSGPLGNLSSTNSYYIEPLLYYSPSNSSLQLDIPSVVLSCNPGEITEVEIPVLFVSNGTAKALIRSQLTSGAQVLWTEVKSYNLRESALQIGQGKPLRQERNSFDPSLVRGNFVIKVPVPTFHLADLKVLVWYVRTDSEVVSTSGELKSEQCLQNPTSLNFSSPGPTPAPNDPVTITLSAAPKSVCGISVADRRSGVQGLTTSAIFEVLNEARISPYYDNTQIDNYNYCYGAKGISYYEDGRQLSNGETLPYPYFDFSDVDAIFAFNDVGLVVLTDLTVETRPCGFIYLFDYFNYDIYESGPPDSSYVPGSVPESGLNEPDYVDAATIDEWRNNYADAWLWKIVVVNDEGQFKEDFLLPDSMMELVGEAVCVHPEKGIGLSPIATISTLTPFALDLTLPPAARLGETIPILLSVFNYQKERLPVRVALQESSSYTGASTSADMCVNAEDKGVAEFIVTPVEVGDIELTFTASINRQDTQCSSTTTTEKSDTITKLLRVKFEGISQERVVSDYFCLVNGQPQDDFETWSVGTPEGIVPDSEKVFVSVTKDLLGPTIQNLDDLIPMPQGCGEQKMMEIAASFYILKYLEAIGQLTPEIEQLTKRNMEFGYQAMLTHARDDGSYDAFIRYDFLGGSTLLTAYALRVIAQASRYITVDGRDLGRNADWLERLQDKDGCFSLRELYTIRISWEAWMVSLCYH
ncbi:murinoglobulin-1-like [Macrobrachium nipponense]|uniref:murinoglobulin-1-like n=1 Tax=Macrobrachium nipponense TaxID=159736 RepID=UPI0030C7A1F3